MNWEQDLAQEIKKGRRAPTTSVCMGEVVSTSPFLVTIQNGAFILDASNSYVCNQLLERNTKFISEGQMEQNGNLNASCPVGSHNGYSASGQFTQEGDIKLDAVWQAGDQVLVVPTDDGQTFFIVDIIKGAE